MSVKVPLNQLGAALEKTVNNIVKQSTFAMMKSINEVAFKSAKPELTKEFKKSFTVRNKNLPNAVYVQKATKEKLQALISFGTVSKSLDWMFLNTVGGEKKAAKGNLAFAGSQVEAFRTGSGRIKSSQRPGNLLKFADSHGKRKSKGKGARPHAFKVMGKNGYQVIGVRSGVGERKVKWLYSLQKMAQIDKKWDFEQIVRKIALSKLPGEYDRQLKMAIATAKW